MNATVQFLSKKAKEEDIAVVVCMLSCLSVLKRVVRKCIYICAIWFMYV